jgi:TPR repeat protein
LACGGWIYQQRSAPAPILNVQAAKPAPAELAPPATSLPSADKLLPVLLQRGNAALATGDITAARLLFERAANAGSAEAALALGKTYDIRFLLETGAVGSAANKELAITWYRRAANLGDHQGLALLTRTELGSRP